MRAIKINTDQKTVEEVQVVTGPDGSQLESMYELIGNDCQTIEHVFITRADEGAVGLYVDEEVLYKRLPGFAVRINGRTQEISGNALLVCNNDEGSLVDLPDFLKPIGVRNLVYFAR